MTTPSTADLMRPLTDAADEMLYTPIPRHVWYRVVVLHGALHPLYVGGDVSSSSDVVNGTVAVYTEDFVTAISLVDVSIDPYKAHEGMVSVSLAPRRAIQSMTIVAPGREVVAGESGWGRKESAQDWPMNARLGVSYRGLDHPVVLGGGNQPAFQTFLAELRGDLAASA